MNAGTPNPLLETGPPWVYVVNVDCLGLEDFLRGQREAGGVTFDLDCSDMSDRVGLFEVFASAAHFPDYFGKNWPAFDECLADLAWLPASSYVFVLRNPQRLLEQDPDDKATFWRIVTKVAAEWADEVNLGEWWDRPGVPFHLVVDISPNVETSEIRNALLAVGVDTKVLRT